MVERAIITTVREYLAGLDTLGIHARKAVLFGSFAQGRADEYSDIDLVVIAPEFDGSREMSLNESPHRKRMGYHDRIFVLLFAPRGGEFNPKRIKKLWQATVSDSRIEPIPCGEQEWEIEQGRPVLEIARREGIVIGA